jgi:hypothetical protein
MRNWFVNFKSVLLKRKINIELLLAPLKHLLIIEIVPEAVKQISVHAFLVPPWSVFSSDSWPALRTIIRITGGFRNNFYFIGKRVTGRTF